MTDISPTQAPYKIQLPTFSGPLDLLLHLIQRSELDITAISLATVADQFLQCCDDSSGINQCTVNIKGNRY